MKRFAYLMAALLALSAWCVAAPQAKEEKLERSPHTAAIQLVESTQQEEIRKIDHGDWWHDVKTREWIVKRPFHPGIVDSTHMFVVTYRIDGKLAQSWLVDTRKKTVEIEKTIDGERK